MKSNKRFQNFIKDLKENQLQNILIFHGQEQYLVKWSYDHLVQKYVQKGWENLDAAVFYDEIETSDLIKNLETVSMISPIRIIWVKEYKHFQGEKTKGYSKDEMNELVKELNNYKGNNIIMFSFESLDKPGPHINKLDKEKTTFYSVEKLTQRELNSFISKQFAAQGIKISDGKIRLIVDLSGYYNRESNYRLYNMVNDIQKIIAHQEGGEITEDDIVQSMNGDRDIYIFDFIEALGNGKREKALTILNDMLASGDTVFHLLPLIVGQFELMVQIKEMLGEGMNIVAIAKTLKVHEFRAKKAMQLANKFQMETLKELLLAAYEIDINIKLGDIDQRTALELLIAKI